MRMRKKGLPLILAAALLLTTSPAAIGFALTEVPMETKLVNVAKNKPVTSDYNRDENSNLPPNLVDDDLRSNNFWFGYKKDAEASFVLDLQRRYPIEQIRIFDRVNPSMPTRGQFEIWGADRADFSDARLLFELNDNNAFMEERDYTIQLSARPICRYLKYQAKASAAVYIREFQVYARVNVTEISRGKTTYTGETYAGLGGDKAVDENFDSAYATQAIADSYNTFTLDLGSATHVDMLEIYARKAAGSNSINGNFKIYGSQTAVTAFDTEDENGVKYIKMPTTSFETLGYHTLASMAYTPDKYTLADGSMYEPYPLYNYQTQENFGCWQTMLDSSEAYRYFTHRKTITSSQAQFSEFCLYQLNPEAYAVTDVSATGATVRFSDFNMDAESLTTGTLQVKDADGHVVEGAISEIVLAENGADAALQFAAGKLTGGTAYTLTVGEEVQNTYGTKTGAVKVLPFTTPAALEPYDIRGVQISSFNPSDANNFGFTFINNTAENKRVLAAIALYNGSKIVSVEPQVKTVAANGGTETFSVTAQNSTATSMKVFLWREVQH